MMVTRKVEEENIGNGEQVCIHDLESILKFWCLINVSVNTVIGVCTRPPHSKGTKVALVHFRPTSCRALRRNFGDVTISPTLRLLSILNLQFKDGDLFYIC
jgi:hypothetical protein